MSEPDAVKVTAADFNGRDWDGCPFSAVPGWLEAALGTDITVANGPGFNNRDYAIWRVKTAGGIEHAFPGDYIARWPDGSIYVRHRNPQAA